MQKLFLSGKLYKEEELLNQIFTLQKSILMRRKMHFCVGMIALTDSLSMDYHLFFKSLQKIMRDSDFAFESDDKSHVLIIFTLTKDDEIPHLMKRIEKKLAFNTGEIKCSVAEIAKGKVDLKQVISQLETEFSSLKNKNETIGFVMNYKMRDEDVIKVSIVENDAVTATILSNIISNLIVERVEIQFEVFEDGVSFLNSEWQKGPQRHIVIINDVLPKMNGIEVIEQLRNTPNAQKFFIYVISNRVSEEAALFAYAKGANQFVTKPFNLNVMEMQLRNYIKGMV